MPTRRALLTGQVAAATPVAIGAHCLAKCLVHCQSCADACPEQAIRFMHRLGAPPLPIIVAARCTGCRDCVAACPVDAIA